ncbi:DUF1758 domain-containing protein [Trichonephila inaurata madagascariensis]|uniref:DUF1758 domain-containing protein n=1 Tax=Trichonephila inaurata madagascariensis TaxID=2747483 RepID=A0A8X7BTG0_9ARAC|nr:DUF1758 domain-containing protein [Trichonephila inaurata madagascariensis]
MEENEKLGHMSPNKGLEGKISYFLPHHAVRRKDSITTKLRVVIDGSCKPPNSNSLNSVLGVCQMLQPDIFTLLLRFRVNEIAFTADIKQMYGVLIQALIEALDARGFHLRKWRSNSRDVLTNISKNLEFNEPNVEIHPENCSKALGLIWDSMQRQDRFIFNINFKFKGDITKRSFLFQSARLFDPLGFLSPRTILIKIFYQHLWLLKLDWDDALPEHFVLKWKTVSSGISTSLPFINSEMASIYKVTLH